MKPGLTNQSPPDESTSKDDNIISSSASYCSGPFKNVFLSRYGQFCQCAGRQIRWRNSLLLFGKPPEFHSLNIFPIGFPIQEFERIYVPHYFFLFHQQPARSKKIKSCAEKQRYSFPIHFLKTPYELKFSSSSKLEFIVLFILIKIIIF